MKHRHPTVEQSENFANQRPRGALEHAGGCFLEQPVELCQDLSAPGDHAEDALGVPGMPFGIAAKLGLYLGGDGDELTHSLHKNKRKNA